VAGAGLADTDKRQGGGGKWERGYEGWGGAKRGSLPKGCFKWCPTSKTRRAMRNKRFWRVNLARTEPEQGTKVTTEVQGAGKGEPAFKRGERGCGLAAFNKYVLPLVKARLKKNIADGGKGNRKSKRAKNGGGRNIGGRER